MGLSSMHVTLSHSVGWSFHLSILPSVHISITAPAHQHKTDAVIYVREGTLADVPIIGLKVHAVSNAIVV